MPNKGLLFPVLPPHTMLDGAGETSRWKMGLLGCPGHGTQGEALQGAAEQALGLHRSGLDLTQGTPGPSLCLSAPSDLSLHTCTMGAN